MAFRVEISPEAFENIDLISSYIREQATSVIAERWFNGIITSIRTLGQMPHRCPLAEESTELGTEVRLFLHGKRNRCYKVYFATLVSGYKSSNFNWLEGSTGESWLSWC
jgi:plasmid stabilization system protein ParE